MAVIDSLQKISDTVWELPSSHKDSLRSNRGARFACDILRPLRRVGEKRLKLKQSSQSGTIRSIRQRSRPCCEQTGRVGLCET